MGKHFLDTAAFLKKTPEVAWRMAYSGLGICGSLCDLYASPGSSGGSGTGAGISGDSFAADLSVYYGRSGFGRKKQKDFYREALSGRRIAAGSSSL